MDSKNLNKILIVANLLLLAALAIVLLRSPEPPAVAAVAKTSMDAASGKAAAAGAPAARPQEGSKGGNFEWKDWLGKLRDAGAPADALARLAREEFSQRWQSRQAEAQAAYARGDIEAEGLAIVNLEHDIEMEAQMRATLGDDAFEEWDRQNVLASLNPSALQLTEAETAALYELEKSSRRQMDALQMARLKKELTPAEHEARQAAAQDEHEKRLKSLLGAQRYAVLRGVDSGAGDLTRALADSGIEAADIPFEQLAAGQQQYFDHRKQMEFQINEAKSQIVSCEQELQRTEEMRAREMERLLGSDTSAALERGQDERYKEMSRFADQWGLDESSTDYLYKMIRYYEKAVEDYQRKTRAMEAQGNAVDWDAVNHNVGLFAQQTSHAVREYLGDERFDTIQKNKIFPFASQ
jgi:hypothetical protein